MQIERPIVLKGKHQLTVDQNVFVLHPQLQILRQNCLVALSNLKKTLLGRGHGLHDRFGLRLRLGQLWSLRDDWLVFLYAT